MKVHVENYQILASVTFEATGITVISGKTSNGKSSLYRAIRSACFGRRGDDFIRIGASSVVVALDFDGDTYAWRKDADNIDFYQGAKRFTKTGGAPPDEYLEALKIKEIELGKFKVAPNFSGQFDSLFLVGLSPVDAASALSSLFSGEKFPQLLKQVSKFIKDTKKEVTFLDGSLATLESQLNELISKAHSFEVLAPMFLLKPQIDSIIEHGTAANTLLDAGLRAQDDVRINHGAQVLKSKDLVILGALTDELPTQRFAAESLYERLIDVRHQYSTAFNEHARTVAAINALVQVSPDAVTSRSAMESLLQQWRGAKTEIAERAVTVASSSGVLALLPTDEELVNNARSVWALTDGWRFALKSREGQQHLVDGIPHELSPLEEQIAASAATLTECPVCTSKLTVETREALLRNES